MKLLKDLETISFLQSQTRGWHGVTLAAQLRKTRSLRSSKKICLAENQVKENQAKESEKHQKYLSHTRPDRLYLFLLFDVDLTLMKT